MADRVKPADIQRRLVDREGAITLHREAIEAGLTFSGYLEQLDPSDNQDRLDAFERQLQLAGIVTRSDPQAGYWASNGSVFFETEAGRALYPEYFARQWRRVAFGNRRDNNPVMLSDDIPAEFRPASAVPFRWEEAFEAAIPLTELVTVTRPVTGTDFRTLFLDFDAEGVRKFRVGEAAEIPIGWLKTRGRAITAHKYGRGLRVSYEQLRRTPIDVVGWWIRLVALQSEIDKVTAALDVLINGDGNVGTGATVLDLTALDSAATPTTLTLKAWLAYRLSWQSPYALTTVLGDFDAIMQLIMLNIGSANLPLANANFAGISNSFAPINATGGGIRYGWLDDVPADTLIGFDRRFALEQVMEIGSEIQETERFITNQTQVLIMSENSGFGVLDTASAKVLDLTA